MSTCEQPFFFRWIELPGNGYPVPRVVKPTEEVTTVNVTRRCVLVVEQTLQTFWVAQPEFYREVVVAVGCALNTDAPALPHCFEQGGTGHFRVLVVSVFAQMQTVNIGGSA